MKYCHNCGNAMDDDSLFCAACGTRVASESPAPANAQEPRTQQMTEPWGSPASAPTPQQSYDPYTNVYTPQPAQEPKPKKKTGKIIAIVLGSLVALRLLTKLLGGGGDDTPAKTDNDDSLFNIPASDSGSYVDITPEVTSTDAPDSNPAAVSYTKGAITNGLYVNKWANLQFDTTGWTNGSAEAYAEEEDEYIDCGLILEYSDGITDLTIDFFSDVPSDEEACMDAFLEGLEENFAGISGLTASFSDYYDTTVAGKTFTTVTVSCTYNGYSFIGVYRMCCYDNRLIYISVTAEDAATADNVAANIRVVGDTAAPIDITGAATDVPESTTVASTDAPDSSVDGEIVDGWYINKSANIRFDTSGWVVIDPEHTISALPSYVDDCELLVVKSFTQLMIGFVEPDGVTLTASSSEEDVLDHLTDLKLRALNYDPDYSYSEYFDANVADAVFKKTTCTDTFYNSDTDSETDGGEMILVRRCDDRFLVIWACSPDFFDATAAVNNIRSVE